MFATVGATKHGYGALNMYLGKFLEGSGDVAKEGQWRRVVLELRLQFIIAL